MLRPVLINIPDLSPANERFVELDRYLDTLWVGLSGQPRSFIERKVKRPRLSRYRGAFEAVRASKKQRSIIVSHAPRMTAAVSLLAQVMGSNAPHISFAFNFTDLPSGLGRIYFEKSLASVKKFIIYSKYEHGLYSEYFNIPYDRFVVVPWSQGIPPVNIGYPSVFPSPYLCAIGGEGRDFPCMIEAARISGVPLVIVARSHSLVGLSIPDNVKVFTNLPLADTWGLAVKSAGVVVSLKTPTTCCGQITVVSAMMLGLPIIAPKALALADYLNDGCIYLSHEFSNPDSLSKAMNGLMEEKDDYSFLAMRNSDLNIQRFNKKNWTIAFENCLDEINQIWN